MNLTLDHIAVLVRSVESTEKELPESIVRHETETFPSEGTKEQYLEFPDTPAPAILLLQAIGEGPYRRTLEKRGAGLHHFGYLCDDLNQAVEYFSSKGLLLHPYSLKTLERKTAWMCRPGVPFLVELSEVERELDKPSEKTTICIPKLDKQIRWMPGVDLNPTTAKGLMLSVGSQHVEIFPDL